MLNDMDIALMATRSYLRSMQIDPRYATRKQIAGAIDDIGRFAPDTMAARWYHNASEAQQKMFMRAFVKWQREA